MSKKFGSNFYKNDWLNVEVELNPFNLRVSNMLKQLGDISQDLD